MAYLAPEVEGFLDDDKNEHDEYTNAVDIWSLGCVAYWLLTQEVPFPSPLTKFRFVTSMIEFPLAPLLVKCITTEGMAFIRKAMAIQPLNRFTASTALRHRWLDDVNNIPHPDPELQNDALHTSGGLLDYNSDEPTPGQSTSSGVSHGNDRAISQESEFERSSAIENPENPEFQN